MVAKALGFRFLPGKLWVRIPSGAQSQTMTLYEDDSVAELADAPPF